MSGATLCLPSPQPPGCPHALTAQAPAVGVVQTLETTDDLPVDLGDGGCSWDLLEDWTMVDCQPHHHYSCPYLEANLHLVVNTLLQDKHLVFQCGQVPW